MVPLLRHLIYFAVDQRHLAVPLNCKLKLKENLKCLIKVCTSPQVFLDEKCECGCQVYKSCKGKQVFNEKTCDCECPDPTLVCTDPKTWLDPFVLKI